MRGPALAAFLVLHIAALREEIGRFELEVGGNDKVSRRNEALHGSSHLEGQLYQPAVDHLPTAAEAFIDVPLNAHQNLTLEEGTKDPADPESTVISSDSCKSGMLHVKGTVMVKEELIFSKDCTTMRGELGSEVILEGPLVFQGALRIEGNLRFSATYAFQRACVAVEGHATVLGNIRFQNCHNENEDASSYEMQGGGINVEQMSQQGGTMEFHNCSSEFGGGMFVQNKMLQTGGTMEFHDCSSKGHGGGMYVRNEMLQTGGTMEFHDCSSKGHGGGMTVFSELSQQGGTIKFHDCSSNQSGGGMYVEQVSQQGGTLEFHDCSSEDSGGGLNAYQLTQENGTIAFDNCSSNQSGGGMYVEQVSQQGGTLEFHDCSSEDSGGGMYVYEQMSQQGGTLEFHDCSSEDSGGAMYVGKAYNLSDGAAAFHDCTARWDGGGMYVYEQILQQGGTIEFHNCSSKVDSGGGMYVKGTYNLSAGTAAFHHCTALAAGGGLNVDDQMSQEGGTMEFHYCASRVTGGGGMNVKNQMSQKGGTMEFHYCASRVTGGGGMYVKQLTQKNGTLEFHNCISFSNDGGGMSVRELTQEHGILEFHGCSSKEGGGMSVTSFWKKNGTLVFHNCMSELDGGGGLNVDDQMSQTGGTLQFHNCSSRGSGGGMSVDNLWQKNGTLECHGCSSKGNGGCMHVYDDMNQEGGTIEFHNCSSNASGGGMYVGNRYFFTDGAAAFHHCMASLDGGGLGVGHFQQAPEAAAFVIPFHHCHANRGGGAFALHKVNAAQPMHFRHCTAAESGGGIQIIGIEDIEGSTLASAHFENCSAAKGTAIVARNITVQQLELVNTFNTTISAQSLKVGAAKFQVHAGLKPSLAMEAGSIEIDSDLDCTQLGECRVSVPASSQLTVPRLYCGLGAGVADTPPFGCVACAEGYTQVENATSRGCLHCPKGADVCRAPKIEMKPGFMLYERNLSRPLHCPTKKVACPGGELPVSNGTRPMCREGYGGEGCAKCVRDNDMVFLMSDANVLACTPCAKGTVQQALQWISFLALRAVLFAVSAASIFGAGNADRVKHSGVYLNQLMAFASVSGSVVTSVMQTETGQMMKSETGGRIKALVEYLYGTAIFVSDASSGQGAKSSQCLLSYLSLEQSGVFGVHCLDVAVATLLVLALSFKDWRVALVAGLNCFLPGIMADFAKYAVCYRLEENQPLICNHLPFSNLPGFVTVGSSFLAVFAVALFIWIRLSSSQQEGIVLSHVAFLTNKYGEGRQYFEAERLVRKVLLDTAAAIFPSTTFPQLQMTALTVITCASMALYGIFQPYNRQLWNWSELGLLATALVLISLASALIANEEQWDKTEEVQVSMVIALGVIVTSVCVPFMIKIALEMWRERRGQAAPSSYAA